MSAPVRPEMVAARTALSSPSSISVTEMQPFSQMSPSSTIPATPRSCRSNVQRAAGSAARARAIMESCSDCNAAENREAAR